MLILHLSYWYSFMGRRFDGLHNQKYTFVFLYVTDGHTDQQYEMLIMIHVSRA